MDEIHRSPFVVVLSFVSLLFVEQDLSASPSVGMDLTLEISGHRWGIWSLVDTPSHDFISEAYQKTEWLSVGSEDAKRPAFYSYLVLGAGPYERSIFRKDFWLG